MVSNRFAVIWTKSFAAQNTRAASISASSLRASFCAAAPVRHNTELRLEQTDGFLTLGRQNLHLPIEIGSHSGSGDGDDRTQLIYPEKSWAAFRIENSLVRKNKTFSTRGRGIRSANSSGAKKL